MSWEDIDFELITKGMITKGPAKVSFADYLNTFAWALDERLNMLIVTPFGSFPDLPNIYFEVGEIRTQNQDHESDFWAKLKSMVQEYYSLWANRPWYTVDIMTDPVNHADYLLEDADLIAIIGQETFDIISDVQNKFTREYFTADVINALYEIYKLTFYARIVIRSSDELTDTEFQWGVSTLSRAEGKTNISSSPGPGAPPVDPHLSFGAADAYARSFYVPDWNDPDFPFNNTLRMERKAETSRSFNTGEDEDAWGVGYNNAVDLVNVYARYRDLDDNLLDMEITGACAISKNYKADAFDVGNLPLTFYAPLNTDFPQVSPGYPSFPGIPGVPGDPVIFKNADPLLGPINHGTNFGSKYLWSSSDGGPIPTPALGAVPPAEDFYFNRQEFEATLDNSIATNINNAGLRFFIG